MDTRDKPNDAQKQKRTDRPTRLRLELEFPSGTVQLNATVVGEPSVRRLRLNVDRPPRNHAAVVEALDGALVALRRARAEQKARRAGKPAPEAPPRRDSLVGHVPDIAADERATDSVVARVVESASDHPTVRDAAKDRGPVVARDSRDDDSVVVRVGPQPVSAAPTEATGPKPAVSDDDLASGPADASTTVELDLESTVEAGSDDESMPELDIGISMAGDDPVPSHRSSLITGPVEPLDRDVTVDQVDAIRASTPVDDQGADREAEATDDDKPAPPRAPAAPAPPRESMVVGGDEPVVTDEHPVRQPATTTTTTGPHVQAAGRGMQEVVFEDEESGDLELDEELVEQQHVAVRQEALDRSTRPPPRATGPHPADFAADATRAEAPLLGIDFGTSYTSAALFSEEFLVIPTGDGDLQMPSVESFPRPGEVMVGREARQRMAGEAQWTLASPKRLLGRPYKDPLVAQHVAGLAFRTFAGTDRLTRLEAHGHIYSVTDICAMILGELKRQASDYLDAEVKRAVFAVPVGHGSLQRSALEQAAKQAGLEVVSLLTEPSASVLTHGLHRHNVTVAVYDFGGGTFDFCVLRVRDTAFQVLCAGGHDWLGGDDFDAAMATWLSEQFAIETGVQLQNRAVEWQALLFACEEAKRRLTHFSTTEIVLPDLLFTSRGKRGLRHRMSRDQFERLTSHLVDKSLSVSDRVLREAALTPDKVDEVVMSGGTALIPAVRRAVRDYFGQEPRLGDPDLAVAKGAALRAAELEGEGVDATALDGRTLKEVAGRTIGAAVKGQSMVTLFGRSTPLPAETRYTFHTEQDDQTVMVVELYESPESNIDPTRPIGKLRYKGIRRAPAGKGKIDLAFHLDEDGMLHVTATVEGKHHHQTIRLAGR